MFISIAGNEIYHRNHLISLVRSICVVELVASERKKSTFVRIRAGVRQEELIINDLLVRIHFIMVMVRWIGLAPWEFELSFPGSLTSTFLEGCETWRKRGWLLAS